MLKLFQRELPKAYCTAVIVAAGQASRMHGIDKIMAKLDGEPVICRSIRAFQSCEAIDAIIVVAKEALVSEIRMLCAQKGFDKVRAVTAGGATRTDSVMAGLDHAPAETAFAAIHDGARPLVPLPVIETAVQTAIRTGAAAPAIPVKDTIKVAENRVVQKTPRRDMLFAVQTPQVFDFDLLRGALQKAREAGTPLTDDCSAVEALGMKVHLTDGSDENIKITTPLDLVLAEAILKGRECI